MKTAIRSPRTVEILKNLPKPETLQTASELDATHSKEAAWAEKHLGPDVPRLTPRGRPRRHAKVAKSTVKAVRLKEAVWESLKERAKKKHLSPNAAIQIAILDWLERA